MSSGIENSTICVDHSPESMDSMLERASAGDSSDFDRWLLGLLTDRHYPMGALLASADELFVRGWFGDALKLFYRALASDEDLFHAWCCAGICHHQLGQLPQAVSCFEAALIRGKTPNIATIHTNLAAIKVALKDGVSGESHAVSAIVCDPSMAEAYYNRALCAEAQQHQMALFSYQRAITLNPLFAQARTNRGKLYQEAGAFDLALLDHGAALVLAPGLEEAMHNRATVLSELRQFDASILSFRRAIQIRPHFPNAHLGLSMTLLMIGNYLDGWAENEWRFLEHIQHGVRQMSRAPRLTPELLSEVKGKKVLLFWEQGLGDTLHFCRYAKCLVDRGARVVLNVQRELLPIMVSLDPRIEITDASTDRLDCDFHAYLMSLAHIFRTEVKTIPAEMPYLSVNRESVSRWAPRIRNSGRPRIGLVFSGAPTFKNDHNRSIPLSQLTPLLDLPLDFHCLQKVLRMEDSQVAERHSNFFHHMSDIGSFEDTAALIESMDLIISVDTSVAHLVGAMARPLWLLIPYTPDNRWFLDRTDSPWYPTATLYRQGERNQWPAVIDRMRSDLIRRFALRLS